ncbi:hypothetical protein AAMO2058_000827800 [Amorphochlora amoebiformis]
MIQKNQLKGYAAIASSLAAETYNLEKLDEGIEDEQSNFTRFLYLERLPEMPPKSLQAPKSTMKTSLVFCLNSARMPGKLFRALSTFSLRDISITKIESRPMKNIMNVIREARRPLYDFKTSGAKAFDSAAKFQYLFYVDILSGMDEQRTQNALGHLSEVCSFLRVLGSYPESREMKDVMNETKQHALTEKKRKPKAGMSILIVGFGTFGQFLAKTFVSQGHKVYGCSRGNKYAKVAESLGVVYKSLDDIKHFFTLNLDCILISVSIKSFEKVVKSLPWHLLKEEDETVVVEVCSVKIHPKTVLLQEVPKTVDILCTHPMFGPESGKYGWKGLPFMYDCVRISNRINCDRFLQSFQEEGCRMYQMSCELHDAYAASSQFITHTTGRVLSKLGLKSTPINTKGFESLLKLVETTCRDSFDLYEGLYRHNQHSKQQLALMRKAFDELEDTLDRASQAASLDKKQSKGDQNPAQAGVNPNVAGMKPSATIQIHSLATALKDRGEEVVSLAVGEPNDTKCPEPIVKAAQAALTGGKTYYTSSVGMLELRKEICAKFLRDNNLKYTPSQIVCSNGAKQSIMQLVTALVSRSDEVIIPAPYWTSYPDICRLAGCKPIIVQTDLKDNYRMSPAQLEAALTPRTRILILCSPSNPTGSVYPKERLAELVKVLQKFPRVFVLADEIYEYITYEGTKHVSIASFEGMYERTAVVNGFSKGFAMTGFRLGYIAAPPPIAKLCAKVQGQITSCPCSISQHAGVAALKMGMGPVNEMVQDFTRKRKFVVDFLGTIPSVKFSKPTGAFYIFPQISAFYGKYTPDRKQMIANSTEFCKHLLAEHKVALVPGAGFGDDRCLRISYAGDINELKTAMVRLKVCLESLVSL